MKPFISLLMIFCFAHFSHAQTPEDYTKLWQQVTAFEKEGLPKSALKVVLEISKKAKNSQNKPQEIKALLYQSKYALTLEEDAQYTIVNDFKTAISESDTPTNNVLHNILATLYWQYFNQNRWKFYNRTNTAEKVDDTDFRTWDLQTLFDEIDQHYQASLANGLILQQTDISEFDAIINSQTDSKIYRPTLFDLLAHNALQFYKTDENAITKPAYKFTLDNPKLLGNADDFSEVTLVSKDSTSLQLKALLIFQYLVKFHLRDNSPEALVDIDLERLQFIYDNTTIKDKQERFLETLQQESSKWYSKKNAVATRYDFEIAQVLFNEGLSYQPKTDGTQRWKLKEAKTICDKAIETYPKSIGAEKCRVLQAQILSPTLQMTMENFQMVNRPMLSLISYKNLETINFSIAKISVYELKTLEAYRENPNKTLDILRGFKTLHSWTTNLKNEQDYQLHSTEMSMPSLSNGLYVLFGEVPNSKTFAFKSVQVTNLAFSQKELKDAIHFQIMDRHHGKPVPNAEVTLSYIKNYQNDLIREQYTTDKNGEFVLRKEQFSRSDVSLKVTTDSDTARFENLYFNRYYRSNDSDQKTRAKGFIFSDRSIYRPGQTLYFKGIVMKFNAEHTEILTNTPVEASLYNVNGEIVQSLTLKTNDYGSVAGEFIIPNNGLTGNYTIRLKGDYDLNARDYISVEEYKRPKFEARFDSIRQSYRINDTVTVSGLAQAYAGSAITDAKVVYRVHRKVRFPDWYYWYRPYFRSEPQEITHGETTTDASGQFSVDFKAIPDDRVDASSLPIFNYEITADITDLNGETRSATTVVNVGYHALTASMSLGNPLDKTDKSHDIGITTKNLNGEFVPAKGHIKIYKLQAPNQVLRPRPWPAPDFQELTKAEFKKQFPHLPYTTEDNPQTWEKGELVLMKAFDTELSKSVALGNIKKWDSGQYLVVLETKDRFDQPVTEQLQTTVFETTDPKIADQQLFQISTDNNQYGINDMVNITLGSAASSLYVTVEIEKQQRIVSKQIINLNSQKERLSIPVKPEDLGGFIVHYSYTFENHFQNGSLNIAVPYPKTDLEIEAMTFRDKLQPGTDETWSFKIKGPKGDKVSAELLASMYDASLDQFKAHEWDFHPISKPSYYSQYRINTGRSFGIGRFKIENLTNPRMQYKQQAYDALNFFGLNFGYGRTRMLYRSDNISVENVQEEAMELMDKDDELDTVVVMDSIGKKAVVLNSSTEQSGGTIISEITSKKEQPDLDDIKIRKNLQETAFFFPQLHIDKDGHVQLSFTTPEALTKWKLQLLAHTKNLESSTRTLETVTQKELMVLPNAPRFLREGDQIRISTKIANLSDKTLSGLVQLQLTDAVTGNDITTHMGILPTGETVQFSVAKNGNTQVAWTLNIPFDVDAVQYKIVAKADDFSDGEQNVLPVLSNRMLVTETLPMWVSSNETRTFTLDKLKTNRSNTLKHHKLALEITSNPAWYAVQALPYLMEYPYDCNEQTFSRYYANALASHIANSNPRIKTVFDQWRQSDALLSNLEKNQELKSILIEETPWLRDAQSESEQKKRIALLFDLNTMTNELAAAKRKLANNQMANGAWPWFNGGRPNRYITQHILTGFGHLDHLGVTTASETTMINKALDYLDAAFLEEYENLKKYDKDIDLSKDHLSYTQLHYLYMRSFFPDRQPSKKVQSVIDYYHSQIKNYWLHRSLYAKGLMALSTHRMGDQKTANKILNSLRETSIVSEELGMYWKSNNNSWYWYQAPIETQALMIEAFSEIDNDVNTIDNLKIWLLKNKQTNRWKTTKATTEAVYALLLQGSDWLSVTEQVAVTVGGQTIDAAALEDVRVEAGTGYYKTSWGSSEITPAMATVTLSKKGDGIAWGALYWQYFEDLDKITSEETPLLLKKKLFKKINTDTGEQLLEITPNTALQIGDLVRVRIELRSDRNMEFLHMKDMRAAGLEPVNVLSQYKWQDGLGYYESTKDAATNFFFDYLPKGIYVFEYDLRVSNAGDMSNGITSIQSMYAPEFSSHSEGLRISVE